MLRRAVLLGTMAVTLAACASNDPRIGPDGLPLPQIYRISNEDAQAIPYRLQDAINTLRAARGAQPLQLDEKLTAAAATHSRDMSVQNRPWHFGSDGSSPVDRLNRVGYSGRLVGEAISESYETELESLSAWMKADDTRKVILDPAATRMGVAWSQEPAGKIWWTLVIAQ